MATLHSIFPLWIVSNIWIDVVAFHAAIASIGLIGMIRNAAASR